MSSSVHAWSAECDCGPAHLLHGTTSYCPPPALLKLQTQIFKYFNGFHPSFPSVAVLFMALESVLSSALKEAFDVAVLQLTDFGHKRPQSLES